MNQQTTHIPPPIQARTPARRTSAASPKSKIQNPKSPIWSDYPALVFSGATALLGEIPCEPTADVPFKFAMPDPRLAAGEDFARTPGMPLRLWPDNRLKPIDGVCFVLSDAGHPAKKALQDRGAIEGEHFIVLDSQTDSSWADSRVMRLREFLDSVPATGRIALLGYGDQGAAIAAQLRDECGIEAARVMVVDGGGDSRQRAANEGHEVVDDGTALKLAAAVIYSPLMRYGRLYSSFEAARKARLPVFDNSSIPTGREQFRNCGAVWLDIATDRAIHVRGMRISPRAHGLPLEVMMVCDDQRRINGVEFPHLTSGHGVALHEADDKFDLAPARRADQLASSTFVRLNRAFLSIIHTPALAVFAARSLCDSLWPDSTRRVFPARCAGDLGSMRFERLLKRHIDRAEIVMASQSSPQQVMLGVAAQQYAADSPIVEIGSALGGSGVLMAAATDQHRPPFHSIDPETATRHVMRWAFQQHDQLDRLRQIIDTSDRAIVQLAHLRGQAGLVFVDGLHTAQAMLNDFVNYAPLVRPGGALLVHDAEPARYSVLRVVAERVLPDPRFAAKCLVDGLMVLERRA